MRWVVFTKRAAKGATRLKVAVLEEGQNALSR